MSVIYEPRGKAKEYCPLAVNLYRGCSHGCRYCYAPAATFRKLEDFAKPVPRKNVLAELEKDLQVFKNPEKHRILLSFTSDPYQPIDKELQITRQAIKKIKEAGHNVVILSKGGMLITRDFDLLDSRDSVGATMTFLDNRAREWEVGAASPEGRIDALKIAKTKGIGTWISLEPVIDPLEPEKIIELTHDFVDIYKVGPVNHYKDYHKRVDWNLFGKSIVRVFEKYGCNYYLKADLRKYL